MQAFSNRVMNEIKGEIWSG